MFFGGYLALLIKGGAKGDQGVCRYASYDQLAVLSSKSLLTHYASDSVVLPSFPSRHRLSGLDNRTHDWTGWAANLGRVHEFPVNRLRRRPLPLLLTIASAGSNVREGSSAVVVDKNYVASQGIPGKGAWVRWYKVDLG